MKIILIALIAYLLGSFCASIPLSRRCCGGDVRLYGSGNAGATNMARVYGLKAGLATLLLDMLKTVAAMLLGEYFMGGAGKAVAGAFCIIGHCFPLYFEFRGGKGVSVGAALGLMTGLPVMSHEVSGVTNDSTAPLHRPQESVARMRIALMTGPVR